MTIRDIEDIPLIICGPVLRKVDTHHVSIFLALKAPRDVKVHIYAQHPADLTGTNPAFSSDYTATTALGENLHVTVHTLHIPLAETGLVPNHIYYYDIILKAFGQNQEERLIDLGLLSAEYAIGYDIDTLPGFMLPPKNYAGLNIFHSSCRKPHGGGDDMLTVLDTIIDTHKDNLAERPQLLLLTGDQIYADDVSLPLLRSLYDTANNLLNWAENIPSPHALDPVLQVPDEISSNETWTLPDELTLENAFDLSKYSRTAPPLRADNLKEITKFTSDAMDGHLMFLGEFYMMYLFVWSDELWPRNAEGEISVPEFNEAVPAFSLSGALSKKELNKSREYMIVFGKGLKKVRRALANIPTYMVFDDHEVTDDWNLNYDWVRKVYTSSAGKHIVRNALIAYAVFQDWGNQPQQYENGAKGKDILEALDALQNDGTYGTPGIINAPDALDTCLNLTSNMANLEDQASGRKTWHFSIDPFPYDNTSNFKIIMLDTRTWRSFPDENDVADFVSDAEGFLERTGVGTDNPEVGRILNAALLSENAFTEQLSTQLLDSNEGVNIVVSAAPVFGLPIIEEVIQKLAVARDNPETHDNEAWNGHETAFENLFNILEDKNVLLLSGDVHYAFSNQMAGKNVFQLCSSSIKNETQGTMALGELGINATAQEIAKMVENKVKEAYDDLVEEYTLKLQEFIDEIDSIEDIIENMDEFLEYLISVKDDFLSWWNETPPLFDPAWILIKFKGIRPFSIPNLLKSYYLLLALIEVLEKYHPNGSGAFVNSLGTLQFQVDERPVAERLLFSTDPPLGEEYDHGKEVVGFNNFGQIRFTGNLDSSESFSHRLIWYAHNDLWKREENNTLITTQYTFPVQNPT